mgnify:CR=1 FL=1
MCVKLNSLFDKEMKVYYVTQVSMQGINIKTMCPNNIEIRSLSIGASKIDIVIENPVC